MKTAAIILAAGESRRMGSPKALLPFRGGTFLSVLAETLGACCSPIVAVFGFDGDRLSRMTVPGLVPAINRDYQHGMLTSLQTGLRTAGTVDRVLFTLVDHPAVQRETIERLVNAPEDIVIPRFAGKRGHPVLIREGIAREFLAEPVTSKVRDVIDRHAAHIRYIETGDPGIYDDIDDPALYRQLLAREALPT